MQKSRRRLRGLGRAALMRFAKPYVRRRAREAEIASRLAHLEGEFEHARERHGEQIERLEDLVRELILATEALRRRLSVVEDRAGRAGSEALAKEPPAGRCRS